jgi:hypothetical protein|tara:strand:- start:1045 stop:1239 length:195 start_codon:yes stop_codon:yes gene_type:complete
MQEDISAYDKERIAHINFLMDVINDSASEIYESLVDRDFENLKPQLKKLQAFLKEISLSIEDDI